MPRKKKRLKCSLSWKYFIAEIQIKAKIKNYLLAFVFVLGNLPTTFFNLEDRLRMSFLSKRTIRIDFFYMYYSEVIIYLIIMYCMYFSKGVDKSIIRILLILSIVDFSHLALFAMRGYGMAKVGICFFIYWITEKTTNKQ